MKTWLATTLYIRYNAHEYNSKWSNHSSLWTYNIDDLIINWINNWSKLICQYEHYKHEILNQINIAKIQEIKECWTKTTKSRNKSLIYAKTTCLNRNMWNNT